MGEAVGAADFFGGGEGWGGIEVPDFGGYLRGEAGGIEGLDAVDAALSFEDIFPESVNGVAQGGDDT
ncbi:MAG: hypothetical protein RI897_3031 [Verrucomicrobiota bacterium]